MDHDRDTFVLISPQNSKVERFILFWNEFLRVVAKNVDHVRRREENGYLHD